ncbi:hypothetical protein [Paenibacillus sp. IHBB 10380]|uniref:hypothetical protein n=1 Tax=Paenibacillus sp. IHBB 10380 TaxID=1566358 RepID=UPI00069707D1|nr:hypothetical protein [Paenibacillus sp. IHBB 10380]
MLFIFYILYLSELGKVPPLIENSRIKFRNDVIHKGKFASYDEASNYGETVFNYIKLIALTLKDKYGDEVLRVYDKNISDYVATKDANDKELTVS